MTLKVTPEQVRSKASEIETQKSAMENLMNEMQTSIQRLPSEYWQSRSGTNFAERYTNVQRECRGALNTLLSHIRNLRDAAQTYDDVEREQEAKVGNLSTQNIFN